MRLFSRCCFRSIVVFVLCLVLSVQALVCGVHAEGQESYSDYVKSMLNDPNRSFEIFAHRGMVGDAPENTWFAFQAAAEAGFDGVESDLRLSADGHPIMVHDETLFHLGDLVDVNGYLIYTDGVEFYYYDEYWGDLYTFEDDYVESSVSIYTLKRVNGYHLRVAETDYSVLRRIDTGVYAGQQYAGNGVMDLEAYLRFCKEFGLKAYIDVKKGPAPSDEESWAGYAQLAKRLGMLENTIWVVSSKAQIRVMSEFGKTCYCTTSYNACFGFADEYSEAAKGIYLILPPNNYTDEKMEACLDSGIAPITWYAGTYTQYGFASQREMNSAIAEYASKGMGIFILELRSK